MERHESCERNIESSSCNRLLRRNRRIYAWLLHAQLCNVRVRAIIQTRASSGYVAANSEQVCGCFVLISGVFRAFDCQ